MFLDENEKGRIAIFIHYGDIYFQGDLFFLWSTNTERYIANHVGYTTHYHAEGVAKQAGMPFQIRNVDTIGNCLQFEYLLSTLGNIEESRNRPPRNENYW